MLIESFESKWTISRLQEILLINTYKRIKDRRSRFFNIIIIIKKKQQQLHKYTSVKGWYIIIHTDD